MMQIRRALRGGVDFTGSTISLFSLSSRRRVDCSSDKSFRLHANRDRWDNLIRGIHKW
jgi:hypothetical protein